jgi:acyl-CoA thioester hydrolase
MARSRKSEPVEPIMRHRIELRVRYPECDPMGLAHHASYPVWFEMGRTEMLRATGGNYRALEEQGMFLAVIELAVRYRRPVRYDDLLWLEATLDGWGPVKIRHSYRLFRGDELLTTASTVLACLGRDGRARPVPLLAFAPMSAGL